MEGRKHQGRKPQLMGEQQSDLKHGSMPARTAASLPVSSASIASQLIAICMEIGSEINANIFSASSRSAAAAAKLVLI